MSALRLSSRAEADILEIASYTQHLWGEAQTIRYLKELETACLLLADNPHLGRACWDVRPGLRRMEVGKHVIFAAYRMRKVSSRFESSID